MSIIPEEELREKPGLNLAPMVDFLFLVVAVFAVIAVTRTALFDFDIHLATISSESNTPEAIAAKTYVVNLSINEEGQYKWISETHEYVMDSLNTIQKEFLKQQELGILPHEKENVKVLLHIDKDAKWQPIAEAIFAVKEMGFPIHPVYEQKN